MTTVATSHN